MIPLIQGPTGSLCVGDDYPLSVTDCNGTATWNATGPGTATFTPPTGLATSMSVDAPGLYVVGVECTEDLPTVGECAGLPFLLDVTGLCPLGPPSWVDWSIAPPSPAGGAPTFYTQGSETYVNVNAAGSYTFRAKCSYYNGYVAPVISPNLPLPSFAPNPNSLIDPIISCPLAVLAGEPINVRLYGCESDSVTWQIFGATSTGQTNSPLGTSAATSSTSAGPVTFTATCLRQDGTTAVLNCNVEVLPVVPGEAVVCETVDIVQEFNNCGFVCNSATLALSFITCGVEECQSTYIRIIVGAPCE